MICPHCGCFFCHDEVEGGRKVYCSRQCKKHASAKRVSNANARFRGCGSKVWYKDQALADVAIRLLPVKARLEGRAEPPQLRSYRCPWCRRFHLTSRPAARAA